jgi:HK97 family phage prohead protease
MNVWQDVLDDVTYNRERADRLGFEHDPDWDEWEARALAELRHPGHGDQSVHGGGKGGDAGFIKLFASPAWGSGDRKMKKSELKKRLKAANGADSFTITKQQAKAMAGIQWRHGRDRSELDTPEAGVGDDRGRLGRTGRAGAGRHRSSRERAEQGDIMNRVDAGAQMQYRSFDISEFEFRDEGSSGFTFEGIASVVDTPYTVRDQYGEFEETIRAGAFNKTLKDSKADVALFVNHDMKAPPLATRGAGTLALRADPHLGVTAQLDPARPDVQIIRSAVSRGEMRQMSIGFSVPKARDAWNEDFTEREISEVALAETSIVWRGASPTTTGQMRSLVDVIMDDDELDPDDLRRALLARGFVLEPAAQPLPVMPEWVTLQKKRPH